MTRSFGSIKVTSTGKYVGRYRKDGKEYYTPSVKTKAQAEADLRVVRRKIQDGEWKPPRKGKRRRDQPNPAMLFKHWAAAWMALCAKDGKSPNTVRSYESVLNSRILPAFGDVEVRSVTATDVRQFRFDLLDSYSSTTVRNTMLVLSAVFSAAVDAGIIEVNPVSQVRGAYRKSSGVSRSQALRRGQLEALIAAADPEFRAAFALAGWGALRYGELAALQRRDVNVAAGTVSVSRSVARAPGGLIVVKEPKTSAGVRVVSLPSVAVDLLAAHLESFTPSGRDALVFARPSTRQGFLTDRVLRRHLHEVCDGLGLPRLRLHDLRHTGLTLYGQTGATLADLMARAGHADAKTVMIYQHSSLDRDRELAAKLENV